MQVTNTGAVSSHISEGRNQRSFIPEITPVESDFQDAHDPKPGIKSRLLYLCRQNENLGQQFNELYKFIIDEFVNRCHFPGSLKLSFPDTHLNSGTEKKLDFLSLADTLFRKKNSVYEKTVRSLISGLPGFIDSTDPNFQFFRHLGLVSNKIRAIIALTLLMHSRPGLITGFEVFNFPDKTDQFIRKNLGTNILIQLDLGDEHYTYLPIKVVSTLHGASTFNGNSQKDKGTRLKTGFGDGDPSESYDWLDEVWNFKHVKKDKYMTTLPVISTVEYSFDEMAEHLRQIIDDAITNDHLISLDRPFRSLSREQQFSAYRNANFLLKRCVGLHQRW